MQTRYPTGSTNLFRLLVLCTTLVSLLSACKGSSNGSSSGVDGAASSAGSFAADTSVSGQPSNSQIRPGVTISTGHGSCTANFIFALGDVYYIGTAAHCFSAEAFTTPNGCELHTEQRGYDDISIENATRNGVLRYSSWDAMQRNAETNADACLYNDFALVEIHPDDNANVHPSAIMFGGPTAMFAGNAAVGDTVYSYGQSPFHLGLETLEAKEGTISEILGNGWHYGVSNDNPGVSGDSGSAVLHENGQALGVLTVVTIGLSLTPVTNGVVDVERALNYAKEKGFIHRDVQLVTWPQFSPP